MNGCSNATKHDVSLAGSECRTFHQRLDNGLFFHIRDLAGFDLVLRNAAGFGRVAGNEGCGTVLQSGVRGAPPPEPCDSSSRSWSQSSSGSSPKGSCCWPEAAVDPEGFQHRFKPLLRVRLQAGRGDLQHPARTVGDGLAIAIEALGQHNGLQVALPPGQGCR